MTYSKLGTDTKSGETVNLYKTSRRQGTYVIAATGVGKSTSLRFLIEQDIKQGIGACVFDPHGDLINDIIGSLHRKEDRDRVLLLDSQDQHRVFGINLYQCDTPTDKKAVEDTVERVRHLFELFWPDISTQPLVSQGIRNSSYAFIDSSPVYGCTLLELSLLFGMDRALRATILSHLQDTAIADWWRDFERFDQAEKAKRSDMVVNKIEEYTANRLLKPIIGQSHSTIDFREVIDSTPGQIVLVRMYGDNERMTQLIGALVIAQLLGAALSRQGTEREKRRQFHLYCDEFELYATDDFTRLLKECRKYGMGMTIAHQSREGIGLKNKAASLQVGNIIVGRVIPDDAEDLAPLFKANPRPGEPEYKPMMQEQFKTEIEFVWEPPEAEQELQQVRQKLLPLQQMAEILFDVWSGWTREAITESAGSVGYKLASLAQILSQANENSLCIPFYFQFNPDFANIHISQDCSLVERFEETPQIPAEKIGDWLLEQIKIQGKEIIDAPIFYEKGEMGYRLQRSVLSPFQKRQLKQVNLPALPSPASPTDAALAQEARDFPRMVTEKINDLIAKEQRAFTYNFIPEVPEDDRYEEAGKQAKGLFRRRSESTLPDEPPWWEKREKQLERLRYAAVQVPSGFWRVVPYPEIKTWLIQQFTSLSKRVEPLEAEERRLAACHKPKEKRVSLGYFYQMEDVYQHTEERGGRVKYDVVVTDARETRYQEKLGQEEPIHNAQARLANELVYLPVGVARCRVQNAAGELEEHEIKLAESTTRVADKSTVEKWIEEIKQRMLAVDKTLRPITDVEQEIAYRHQRLRQSLAQNQQPPPVARKAASPCPKCGFSNRQGANFCNQCGNKL